MSRPRVRTVTGVIGAAIVMTTLTGCGQSEYCKAVEANQVALNSLGEKKSNEAFLTYARAFRTVARVAPSETRAKWTVLADVTQAVVAAHTKAGISMEDMGDQKKLLALIEQPERQAILNKSYAAFNDTADERKAVVKNVKDECEITLT